jgi:hypothetical protein
VSTAILTKLRISPELQLPVDEMDKAWAAGFFEGEGTVSIGRRWTDDTFRLQVSASGVDTAPLRRLQTLWGGSLNTIKGRARHLTRREAWVWTLQSRMATRFLSDVGPYFVSDRQIARAKLALSFQRSRPYPGGARSTEETERQRAIYLAMRAINVRGVRGIEPSGRPRLERPA